MNRWVIFVACLSAFALIALEAAAEDKPSVSPDLARVVGDRLQIGLDPANGSLRELIERPESSNQLMGRPEAFGLWQITLREGETTQELSAERAPAPQIDRLGEGQSGLRLVWDNVRPGAKEPLRVEVQVRLDPTDAALSRWELSIAKPRSLRLTQIRFPRVPALKPRAHEVLAVPKLMGTLLQDPRKVLQGSGKGRRFSWPSPWPLTVQCLAYYEPDGPGFYAACDDTQGYRKTFSLWGDAQQQVHFEVAHEPEQAASETSTFELPYAVLLGTFRGDWTTAAERYRQSPAACTMAERGRLRRGLVPDWVEATGLWVWNRGRSPDVLVPAAELQKHLQVPVSLLWHWWHNCPYDAGFPEYLPPREGTAAFQTALDAAHRQGLHAILYMNQRLWGTTTASWSTENAEAAAVKGPDGKIRPEVYNTYLKAPCAPMCIATSYWRNKYAGLACEALGTLNADGVYMDQTGVTAACHDPRHGHILGPGRYWTDHLTTLTAMIRDQSSARGRVALGGEYCGEPWIGDLDVVLCLEASADRSGYSAPPWEVIPFFQAVYHSSAVTFGNYTSLAYPPYDERWPAELAPKECLTLLDRKFGKQFCLEQAKTFVWGIQPMIPNFRLEQLTERPEELDYLTRLVRVRHQTLKYLLHGTWLRPPALDVPQREIDAARVTIYSRLTAFKRQYPVALAGAWRAPDGDVGIALASIDDAKLPLRLAIDSQAYRLPDGCPVYRLDETGRHRLSVLEQKNSVVQLELPPRGLCVLEFRAKEKP
jgi:hypothetical protein